MKISGIFFAIVILAFLLPFMVVKCGDTKVASISGLKLVTGGEVKMEAMDNMFKGMNDALEGVGDLAAAEGAETQTEPEKAEDKSEPMKPNMWAILALLAAIAGLVTALIMDKRSFMVPFVIAIIGFITLLLVKGPVTKQVTASAGNDVISMIKVQYQFGYILALLGFVLAAILAFLAGRKTPIMTQEQFSNIIPDKMENAFDKAKDTVTQAGAGVAGAVGGAYDKVKDKIEDANLDDKFDKLVDDVKGKIDDANLDEKFDKVVDNVKDKVGEVADKVKDAVDPDEKDKA